MMEPVHKAFSTLFSFRPLGDDDKDFDTIASKYGGQDYAPEPTRPVAPRSLDFDSLASKFGGMDVSDDEADVMRGAMPQRGGFISAVPRDVPEPPDRPPSIFEKLTTAPVFWEEPQAARTPAPASPLSQGWDQPFAESVSPVSSHALSQPKPLTLEGAAQAAADLSVRTPETSKRPSPLSLSMADLLRPVPSHKPTVQPVVEQGPMGLQDFLRGLTQAQEGTTGEPQRIEVNARGEEVPARTLSAEGMKKLPFVGVPAAALDAWNIIRAARRVRDGEGTDADVGVLEVYQAKEAEAATRGTSFAYDVARIASEIPAFADEFAATGGAFTGVKKLVSEALEQAIKRGSAGVARVGAEAAAERFLPKAAGYLAGSVAQTAAMPHRVVGQAVENIRPTDLSKLDDWNDDFLPALGKAVPDMIIEVGSERGGKLLEGPLEALGKLPVAQRLRAVKETVMEKWLGLHPDKGMADFLATIREKTGWNGVLGELFEERLADVARAAQPWVDAEDRAPMVRAVVGPEREQALKEFGYSLLVEATAFAVPGAIGTAAGYVGRAGVPDAPIGGPVEPTPATPGDVQTEPIGRPVHGSVGGREMQPPRVPTAQTTQPEEQTPPPLADLARPMPPPVAEPEAVSAPDAIAVAEAAGRDAYFAGKGSNVPVSFIVAKDGSADAYSRGWFDAYHAETNKAVKEAGVFPEEEPEPTATPEPELDKAAIKAQMRKDMQQAGLVQDEAPAETSLTLAPKPEAEPAPALSVRFGRRVFPVASLEEAARAWDQLRDAAVSVGEGGASNAPEAVVVDGSGAVVARISYNGRLWDPNDPKKELIERHDGRGFGKTPAIETTAAEPTSLAARLRSTLENTNAATVGEGPTRVDALVRHYPTGAKVELKQWGLGFTRTIDVPAGGSAIRTATEELLRSHQDAIRRQEARPQATPEADSAEPAPRYAAPTTKQTEAGVTVAIGTRGSVEVRFAKKPDPAKLDALKRAGFKWAKTSKSWYHPAPGNLTSERGSPEAVVTAALARTRELVGLDAPVATAPKPSDNELDGYVTTKPPVSKQDGPQEKMVGRNQSGKLLHEGQNGVRFYVDGGLRVTEPVRMVPTRVEGRSTPVIKGVPSHLQDTEGEWLTLAEIEKVPQTAAQASARIAAIMGDKPPTPKVDVPTFKIGDRVRSLSHSANGTVEELEDDPEAAGGARVRLTLEGSRRLSSWTDIGNLTTVKPPRPPAPAAVRPSMKYVGMTTEGVESDIEGIENEEKNEGPLTPKRADDLAEAQAELGWREKHLLFDDHTNAAMTDLLAYVGTWDRFTDPTEKLGEKTHYKEPDTNEKAFIDAQAPIMVDVPLGHPDRRAFDLAVAAMSQSELAYVAGVIEGHIGDGAEESPERDRAIQRLRRSALEAAGQQQIDFTAAPEPVAAPGRYKAPTTAQTKAKAAAPTTYEATKAGLDAEEEAIWAKVRAEMNKATTGFNPVLGGLAIDLLKVYAKRGINNFEEAVRLAVEKVGRPMVEKMSLYLDAGWEIMHPDAGEVSTLAVLTSLPEAPTLKAGESDDTDAAKGAVRGGPGAGTRDAGEPAGGPGTEGVEGVAGQQPSAPGVAPDAEGASPGGKRGAAGGRGGARRGAVRTGRGRDVRTGDGTGQPSDVDAAGTSDAEAVAASRGQRPLHFRIPDAEVLTEGASWIGKLDNNMAALRLLKQLQADKRMATADEQVVIAKYIGWGHTVLSKVVDPRGIDKLRGEDPRLIKAREELDRILEPKELQELGESTVNAHYSFSDIPKAIWTLIDRLGFRGGSVLEPAVGTGHFFGTMPESILAHPRTALFGVDKEPIAAAIAGQLYQGAHVQASPLQSARVPPEFFDVVVSNVPFGKIPVFDPAFVSGKKAVMTRSIHNYYFGKALDAARPGGLVVFVTSRYTMDAQNDSVRNYIAERAHFLGAFRMPSSAFQATAGTEVVTDVIVLQKKGPGIPDLAGPSWLESKPRKDLGSVWNQETEREELLHVNEYYSNHKRHILGTEDRSGKMQFNAHGYNVVGALTAADLARVVDKFPTDVYRPVAPQARTFAKDVPLDAKNGSFVLDKAGDIAVYNNGTLEPAKVTGKTKDRIKAFIPIRDAYQVTLDAMVTGQDDATLAAAQKKLRSTYDAFVAKFGQVNDPLNWRAIKADPNASRVVTLELVEVRKDKVPVKNNPAKTVSRRIVEFIGLADVFTKRVVLKVSEPTAADTPQDALVQSLAWKGGVDLEYMSGLLGQTPDQITAALTGELYRDPITQQWVPREEYVAGDVVTKFEQAKAAAQTDPSVLPNVAALEKVQPAPRTPENFEAPFGVTWVPSHFYKRFLEDVGRGHVDISLSNSAQRTKYYVVGRGMHEFMPKDEQGADLVDFQTWAAQSLNNELPQIKVTKDFGQGEVTFVDDKLTESLRESLQQLREQWAQWWKTDNAAAEELTALFNAMFNREAPRHFDGSRIVLPNTNPEIEWRPWQQNAIWRALQTGNTLVAHAVGSGKTFAGIAIAGEWKRLGLANKPLIVVPNNLIEQWRADFQHVYPGARVLVPEDTDFDKDRRQQFIARVANQDWDAVIMAQSHYLRVAVKLETLTAFIEGQVQELIRDGAEQTGMSEEGFEHVVETADRDGVTRALGRDADQSVKDIVRAILSLRARLQKRLDQQARSSPVTFEELGVDGVIVDEAHNFKNLYFSTSRNGVVGLKGSDADRAMDMFLKARLVNEQSRNRNLVFLTGTPVTNTMSEVYTVFRYLAQATLDRFGMSGFDSWVNAFAVASAEPEPQPGGGYKERNRLRNWQNLRDLSGLFRRFADVLTFQDLKNATRPDGKPWVTLPKVRGGHPTIVAIQPTADLDDYMEDIGHRLADLAGGKVNPRDDNWLKVYGQASLAAIDVRLVRPSVADDPNGRIATAARKIVEEYKQSEAGLGTQLVFLNVGTPKADRLEPLNLTGAAVPPAGKKASAAVDDDVAAMTDEGDDIQTDDDEKAEAEDRYSALSSGFSLYDDLKRKLIKQGIPAHQIAYIHQAQEPSDKIRLFRAVREGRIRVLVGTGGKMGMGMNVQDRIVAIHELDAPWRPDWMEQQEGRGIRQGNMNEEVAIFRYVTVKSFDEYRWNLLAIKQDFLTRFYRGEIDTMEDVDPAQMDQKLASAIASGNPDALTLVTKERDLRLVRSRATTFTQRQRGSRRQLESGDELVATYQKNVDLYAKLVADVQAWHAQPTVTISTSVDGYRIVDRQKPLTFDWKDTDQRKAFQAELERMLRADVLSYRDDVTVGRVGPFVLSLQSFHSQELQQDQDGKAEMVRIRQTTPALYVANEEGQPIRGASAYANMPAWDDAKPPDYRRSLDAHVTAAKAESMLEWNQAQLTRWDKTREDLKAILTKVFPQQAELDALEVEVRRLRISVGQEQAESVQETNEAKRRREAEAKRLVDAESDLRRRLTAMSEDALLEAWRATVAFDPSNDSLNQLPKARHLEMIREVAEKKNIDLPTLDAGDGGVSALPSGLQSRRRAQMRPLPTRQRTADAPTPEQQLNRDQILERFRAFFPTVAFGLRRFRQRASGIYKSDVDSIRVKMAGDLFVRLHELGHYLDQKVMQITPRRAVGAAQAIALEMQALGEATTPPGKMNDPVYKRREGAAEFLRLWFMEPDVAAQQAPLYLARFEEYLANTPRTAAFFVEQQRQIQGLLSMDWEQELEERIDRTGKPSLADRAQRFAVGTLTDPRNGFQRMNDALNDDLLPILRMEQAMEAGLPAGQYAESAYVAFRRLVGTGMQAQTFLEDAIRRPDGTIMGPGLFHAVKDVLNKDDYDAFTRYLIARRAEEYEEQGLETGIRPSAVRAAMTSAIPDRFVTAAQGVTDYFDTLLHWAVERGHTSADSAEAMRARNTRYVPWERITEAIANTVGRKQGQNSAAVIKARTGGAQRIADPLETSIRNTHQFVRAVEQNAARVLLVDLAKGEGGARFLERIPPDQVATRFNLKQVDQAILAVLEAHGVTVGDQLPNDIDFDAITTVFMPAAIASGQRGVITVLRDGQREWYEVHDDSLWEILVEPPTRQSGNIVAKTAKGAATLLRRTATATLSFAFRNIIRDTIDAKTKARYRHSFLRSLGAVGLIVKNDESYQRFKASRAGQASLIAFDRDYAKQTIRKLRHSSLRRLMNVTVLNPFEGLRALAELSDTATRLQAFKETEKAAAARGRGGVEAEVEAAFAAREITQDFNKMGSVIRVVNPYEAFLGARVGGWTRAATALGNKDTRNAYAFKAFMYGILPGLLLWWLHRDDEEYQELPAWEKAAYWHVPNGRGDWVRLPRPFDVGDVGNGLEAYLDWAIEHDPEAIQRLPWYGASKQDALKTVLMLAPTSVKPIMEVLANYDEFRDRTIVSPWLIASEAPLEDQASQWTTAFSRKVAPAIGLAPAFLDHIIYGYTSATGQFVTSTASKVSEALRWSPAQPTRGWRDVPGVGAFVGLRATSQSQSLEVFRRQRDDLDDYWSAYNKLVKNATPAEARAYLANRPDLQKDRRRLHQADEQIRLVTKSIQAMRNRMDLTGDEKRVLYDRMYDTVIDLARGALDKKPLPARHQAVDPGLLLKVPPEARRWLTRPRRAKGDETDG